MPGYKGALTPFEKKVLDKVKSIPRGKLMTYKLLALAVKRPKAVRAVGNALAKNPQLIKIPCHRVVRSNGQVGYYRAGQRKKIILLKEEGLPIKNNKIVNIKKFLIKYYG